jgi:hypothetical protein
MVKSINRAIASQFKSYPHFERHSPPSLTHLLTSVPSRISTRPFYFKYNCYDQASYGPLVMAELIDVLSTNNVSMLKTEISRCVGACNHNVLWPGFVPSRLLDIGADGAENDSLRLITRGDIISKTSWIAPSEHVKYAALSYCWGRPCDAQKQCKTERKSLKERLHAIPFIELTPVLRDAVIVARRLSIPYLWADSLCIIQDDTMDWENEASLMGLVYSNAHITICSLSSSTCQNGFLERPSQARKDQVEFDEMLTDWHCSSWSRRGWTFQEEKLSTRLVYFGASRIHFCCGNWIYTENHPTSSEVYERSIIDMGRDGLRNDRVQLLMDFWTWNLVPQFSRREFTKAEDKLPAIAGVAKYIGDVTGDDYVAGIWKSRLFVELIWCCDPLEGQLTALLAALGLNASHYIAPSWSWARFASVNRINFFFEEEETRLLKIEAKLEVSATRVGPNVYGRISDGELTMTTKVLPVLPCYCRIYRGENYNSTNGQKDSHSILCILDWSRGELDTVQQIKFALVGSYTNSEKTRKRYYGILVHPFPISGKYYRVGIFDSPVFDRDDLNFEEAEVKEIIVI